MPTSCVSPHTLQRFRHELRRSVAYIAEQMEERGHPVDWESLYVQAIATDVCTHPNLLSSLSEGLYSHVYTCLLLCIHQLLGLELGFTLIHSQ